MIYGVEFSANWRSERLLVYGNLAISRSMGRPSPPRSTISMPRAGLYRRQVCPHRPRPAVHRLGRRDLEGLEGGRLRRPCSTAMGCARGFANPRSWPPTPPPISACSRISVLPDGGTWTARLDLINAFDTQLPVARRQRDRRRRAAVGCRGRLLGGAEPRPVGATGRCGTACPARVTRPVRARTEQGPRRLDGDRTFVIGTAPGGAAGWQDAGTWRIATAAAAGLVATRPTSPRRRRRRLALAARVVARGIAPTARSG